MQVSFSPRERNITLAAVMVVFLLGALDNTIVSTAMPRIIAELNGLTFYTWVTTAYLLASTVMVPIYGKLSDIFGRKPILIVGISIFLLGSMLCGLAGEFETLPLLGNGMVQLIIFRALQGLGGAALFSSAFAIIADMIPPAERGKYQGLFGGVFGLASVLGPIIGGFFTDHGTVTLVGHVIEGWRWVFYVNVPLGLFALFLIASQMPDLNFGSGKGKIDYLGAALIIITFVPLLLGLTWAGSTYPWGSAIILGLLGLSLSSLILFLIVESRVSNPILPLELFKNKIFALANLASFIVNIAFLGIVMFLPLFMQLVLGISATNSGFTLLPLMAGLIISSTLSGLLVSKLGHYKPVLVFGAGVLLLGTFLLSNISLETTQFGLAWRMVIVGIGLGPSMSLFTLAIQNAVPMSQLGIATSASQFFRQIGSTIGLAVFGSLLTLSVSNEIPKYIPNIPGMESQKFDIGALSGLGQDNSNQALFETNLNNRYAQMEAALNGDTNSREALLANPLLAEEVGQVFKTDVPLNEEAKAQILSQFKASLEEQANILGQGLEQGIKQGFAVSIRFLFIISFWIIVLGAFIMLFIPDQTLRRGVSADPDISNNKETTTEASITTAHD